MERRYRETGSDMTKQEYETFMRITPCKACHGQRLKKASLAVTIADKNIHEITSMSVKDLRVFLEDLELTPQQHLIGDQILKEIRARVGFLIDVGLEYLTPCPGQREHCPEEKPSVSAWRHRSVPVWWALPIFWMSQASVCTSGIMISFCAALKNLRDLGNTLIVVEHDEDTMRAADYIVDIGPGAGEHGGEVVAAGTVRGYHGM